MAYTSRVLPAEEYHRLTSCGLAAELIPDPVASIVVVVEEDGVIIGRWLAYPILVLEGLEIVETARHRPGVVRRLWLTMMQALRDHGIPHVFTLVRTKTVADLAEHGGFVIVSGTLFQKDLTGDPQADLQQEGKGK